MKVVYKNGYVGDIKETDTQGKHSYIVALCCGGLMEDPDIHYRDYQLIRADSEREAKEKYDKLNNCSYFYGRVMGQIE